MPADKRMKIGELLDLGDEALSRMTDKEIRAALRTAVPVANKRLRALEAHEDDIATDALESATRGGGKFGGMRGSTRQKALSELTRTIDFLRLKTSTVKEAQRVEREREKRIGAVFPGLSDEQLKEISKDAWKQYDKFKEEYPGVFMSVGSDAMQEMFQRRVQERLYGDALYFQIRRDLGLVYETTAEEEYWRMLTEEGWEAINEDDLPY